MEVGDRVKLITYRHGSNRSNPVYGGIEGKIMGVITSKNKAGLECRVGWDNRASNSYNFSDLALVNELKFKIVKRKEC